MMHGPLNVKLWEKTWLADTANKISLDSQRFWKDEPIAFCTEFLCTSVTLHESDCLERNTGLDSICRMLQM